MILQGVKLLSKPASSCNGLLKRDHHILVLSTAYNGLTQRVHTLLNDKGHEVDFRLAISPEKIAQTIATVKPDFTICPFLQQKIPDDVCKNHLCMVFHPGIPGDAGPNAIDWAMINKEKRWGGILLQANEVLDEGPIWSANYFPVPAGKSKASIYRQEMTDTAVKCVNEFLEKYDLLKNKNDSKSVTKQIADFPENERGQWRDPVKQTTRKINWSEDTTDTVIAKVNCSDSTPGVADEFCGKKVFLFGAHAEDTLKGTPKQVIAKRHGAICVGTKDGAVWISHMKEAKGGTYTYKLKSVQILGEDKLANVPRSDYEIFPEKDQPQKRTYRQIWYKEEGDVGVLHYDFYNGAMGTGQCNRLKEAYLKASRRPIKVLVLSGGEDFFSNGVDLNNIHAASDPAMESWYNINAINGVCKAMVLNTKQITLSAVRGGAGAGGVYLATASDYVAVCESTILNPHYKTMGLFGSELHTYTAPQRVGVDMAMHLKEKCLPISAETSKNMKLVDYVLPKKDFHQGILSIAKTLAADYPNLIKQKVASFKRSKVVQAITAAEAHELSIMYDNFVGSVYNNARTSFVKKSGVNETPSHLANCDMSCFKVKPLNCPEKILDGEAVAENMKASLVEKIMKRKAKDPNFAPGLAIIQVGNRADSALYIKKKLEMAKEIGIKAKHIHLPANITKDDLFKAIDDLNNAKDIHGVMVQMPLDSEQKIEPTALLNRILPDKDVDAIGSTNIGRIKSGDLKGHLTCTPAGVIELIKAAGITIQGSRAVVIGRSVVVGGTVAELLNWHNATVTTCHEYTHNLKDIVSTADIVVAAVGIPNYIKGNWIKTGAVVVDCGINQVKDSSKKSGYRTVGDVEFESAARRAFLITPVPGGAGPMTVQMLMSNTVRAALEQ